MAVHVYELNIEIVHVRNSKQTLEDHQKTSRVIKNIMLARATERGVQPA